MTEAVIMGILSYAVTNIDDIFINTLFFAEAKSRRQVFFTVIGKYLGIATLVAVSLMGSIGFAAFFEKYIPWLGVIPILLGIKAIFSSYDDEQKPRSSFGAAVGMMLVTVANGADNIGVYLPLFASVSPMQTVIITAVFAVMTALWCYFGKRMADTAAVSSVFMRYGRVIVPAVYIGIGAWILISA